MSMTNSEFSAVSSRRTANSLLWSAVENGALAVVSVVTLIAYSRMLSVDQFGTFSIISAIVELASLVVTMLFHDALIQKRDATNIHFDTAFTSGMIISVVLLLGCWSLSSAFSQLIGQPAAAAPFAGMGLIFPCLAASATVVAQQRREFRFRSLAVRSLSGRISGGLVGVAAALSGAGIWSLVLQQLVNALVSSIVLLLSCDRMPRLRFGRSELRQLLQFGTFSLGAMFLSFSVKRIFTLSAGLSLGVTGAGYLNLAFRIIDVFWSISATAVGQVSLPMLAGLQSEPERLRRVFHKSVELSCFLLYPIFLGVSATAPELVTLMFGARWMAASPYISALACLVLVQAPRLSASPIMVALGRPGTILIGIVVEICFMLSAIVLFGMPTLSWASGIWLASEVVPVPVSAWILMRITGYSVSYQFSGARTPFLAVATMVGAVLIVRHLLPGTLWLPERLVLEIATGAIIYFAAVFVVDRKLLFFFTRFVTSAFDAAPLS